ncbi:hypothetical protein F7725_007983, partial [Dissostichus mawsoni]
CWRERISRGKREGEREIAASVTDKSVAELVSLTAPWGWGKREQVHQSVRQGCCLHTQTHSHTLKQRDPSARVHQKKFREKTDFKKNSVVFVCGRLFELDPELLTLFHYTTNCGSTQDCLSSPEFLEHVTKVMLVIDAAVSNLDDLPSLEDFLLNLGRKHQAEVGESLLYMLQCSLGQAYTAPLRQAWLNLYSIVVAAMSQGWAKNGEDKAD